MSRSCEHCKWRLEQENPLLGTLHVCDNLEIEIKLDSYCEYFKERKNGKVIKLHN